MDVVDVQESADERFIEDGDDAGHGQERERRLLQQRSRIVEEKEQEEEQNVEEGEDGRDEEEEEEEDRGRDREMKNSLFGGRKYQSDSRQNVVGSNQWIVDAEIIDRLSIALQDVHYFSGQQEEKTFIERMDEYMRQSDRGRGRKRRQNVRYLTDDTIGDDRFNVDDEQSEKR